MVAAFVVALITLLATVGRGHLASVAADVMLVFGGLGGAVLAVRHETRRCQAASASPEDDRSARIARTWLIATGGAGQLAVGIVWEQLAALAAVGGVLCALALVGAWSDDGLRAVRWVAPAAVLPTFALLPIFGLGLLLAPAAIGIGVAALVPDAPRAEHAATE